MTRAPLLAATLVAGAVIGAGGGVGIYAAVSEPQTTVRQVTVNAQPAASTSTLSVKEIYRRTAKGVVEITVAGGTSQAQGSGFVYDRSGNIVTNQHVVDGASSISVRFWNGATYEARLVGSDASTDLAVLKVSAPTSLLSPLALADSTKLAVGDSVVAIGSPFGLEQSVTSGIVSALHRQMTAPNGFAIDNSIQTDAAINHGNSGGPLLNSAGRVVGVNAQIESESGGNEGVGFAIPSNTVRSIVLRLVVGGTVEHAYLGVAVETIPSSVAGRLGLAAGVEVADVKTGTPAEEAGLQAATGSQTIGGQSYPTGGDVITAADGKPVRTAAELRSAIDAKRPGDTLSLTYARAGETRTVRITLTNRPA